MSELERVRVTVDKTADRALRCAGRAQSAKAQVVATVHLDDSHCLEVTALRGRLKDVRHLAEHMIGTTSTST